MKTDKRSSREADLLDPQEWQAPASIRRFHSNLAQSIFMVTMEGSLIAPIRMQKVTGFKGVAVKTRVLPTEYASSPLDFVGDHPAINFINTLRMKGGELIDTWQTDEDVAAWIVREGLRDTPSSITWPVGALLRKARNLREIARKVVEARKYKKAIPLEDLNYFLEHSVSHCILKAKPRTELYLDRVYRQKTVEEYLAPVAESVAELLSHADFELVRHCEGEQCVLWFYDRTKSHRRRWCSPQFCGNRAKVAAFRERSKRSR